MERSSDSRDRREAAPARDDVNGMVRDHTESGEESESGAPRPAWAATLLRGALRFGESLSTPGELVATLFFAASLTPSLLPRSVLMQGVLSGLALAAGYGLGVFGRWLWSYMELPLPGRRTQANMTLGATVVCLVVAVLFLVQAAEWQNSIRGLMELEPVDSARPFRVGLIASAVGVALLALGRLFGLTFRTIAHWLHDHVPRRVGNVVGAVLAVSLFWLVIEGVAVTGAVRGLDAWFQQVDAHVEPDVEEPASPLRTGGPGSLVSWGDLGRRGREFVASGPRADDLAAWTEKSEGPPVLDPIRVYVGLNSAPTIEDRADLALQELLRVGAFERSALVIATPTGTGWVDPDGMTTMEHLLRGDVATVAVQYSYLPSYVSLLVEPELGEQTARAVFERIYGHWTELPADRRPRLYLYGISLGALNSERAADFYDILGDPYDGALWAGPPFRSEAWRTITRERKPGSPAWLPRFRDGSIVRFTNQFESASEGGSAWGPTRIVYLQYGSDPITFFEPRSLYRPPEWMAPPRAPDVSPELRWYPVVTMLQLAVDIAAGAKAPTGYGHVYAPEDYVDAWMAVLDPPGWTGAEVETLQEWFRLRRDTLGPR